MQTVNRIDRHLFALLSGFEIEEYQLGRAPEGIVILNVGSHVVVVDGSPEERFQRSSLAKKVTLDCTWSHRTASEISGLLNAVKPYTFVQVNYPDPMVGDYVTKTFYTGDVSCEMDVSDSDEMYWSVKLTFIER